MASPAAGAGEGKGACELCGAAARVYCGADEATLCWGCDAQVHGANFLVARHARALLCRGCAAPTAWRAAGPRLGPTASLCERCFRGDDRGDEEMAEDGDEGAAAEDGDDDEEDEEGEGENQVVPWAEEATPPPPVASSTSSSSRESPAAKAAATGANAAGCAKDDVPCSTSQPSTCHHASAHGIGRNDEATSSRSGGRFLASGYRKRPPPADFLDSAPAQPGRIPPARNCSNAATLRNDFVRGNLN